MPQKPRIPICKAAVQALQALSITAPPPVITGEDLLRMAGEEEQKEEDAHG